MKWDAEPSAFFPPRRSCRAPTLSDASKASPPACCARRFRSFKGCGCYDSFTYPQYGNGVKFVDRRTGACADVRRGGRLCLSRIGQVKVYSDRPLEGLPKTCTLRRRADGWYACIVCVRHAVAGIIVGREPSRSRPAVSSAVPYGVWRQGNEPSKSLLTTYPMVARPASKLQGTGAPASIRRVRARVADMVSLCEFPTKRRKARTSPRCYQA
jgi:hypothetical protein